MSFFFKKVFFLVLLHRSLFPAKDHGQVKAQKTRHDKRQSELLDEKNYAERAAEIKFTLLKTFESSARCYKTLSI